MANQTIKATNQQRFGDVAERYVTASALTSQTDLARLVALAQPKPDWQMLDVATGGGHTARSFAPHVRRVIATDLTPRMLHAARRDIIARGHANVTFCTADAEDLPFASATFDLVTCRIAPHHFPDVQRFVDEAARVLQPGGLLLVQDHVSPDDDRAARYVDAFETLRDPSHVRAYAAYEWRGMVLNAGLTVEHTESFTKRHDLLPWAERQNCTPDVVERLQVMLLQAPAAAAAHLQADYAGTDYAAFCNHHVILLGRRP